MICEAQGIGPEFSFEGRLEMTTRENEKGKATFLLNHGSESGWVDLKDVRCEDLLHGKIVSGRYEIEAGDVAVLWRETRQEQP